MNINVTQTTLNRRQMLAGTAGLTLAFAIGPDLLGGRA